VPKSVTTQQWLTAQDEALCVRFNQASRIPWLSTALRVVSRLGDGLFWYALMLGLLAWGGYAAWGPVLHMVSTGVMCILLYKWVKTKTIRPRPYQANRAIRPIASPLDEYSFPSGHTLHAVAFTLVCSYYFLELALLLVPFTLLVALSRVVLGLHYPSDVLAGAAIGSAIASLSICLW
jgi:undecaprenyl-diphosphatase